MLDFGVNLGQGIDGLVTLSKDARDVHMHVLGLSRQGKSYFLEHLIRQDIQQGAGVCVIDPHGELYGNLIAWLAENDLHKSRRIHLINPADGDWSVGFNPLCHDDQYVSARVGAMIDACQKVWEDNESTGYKTLARLLDLVFSTLAALRLSLREANLLTTLQHRETRQRMVAATKNIALIEGWAEFNNLRPSEFVQQFQSVHNRLHEMTQAPGIAAMIGQTENVIDFKTCMDDGHVVLVNLAHKGKIKPSVANTVGALITADLFHAAQTRDIATAKHQPYYCYIDECGDYLNETVVKGLDQTAKFGLHYVLSHQRLSQLGQRKDDPIRNGVMGGAQSKVVFLEDDLDTAQELGDLLFGKELNLELPIETLIKPTVTGYTRDWLEAESQSSGSFSANGENVGAGTGLGQSIADRDDAVPVIIETSNESSSSSESSGWSHTQSQSRHEALVPIMKDLPTAVHSLEGLRHLAVVEIRSLKKRQAFAYAADDRTARQFVTADISQACPTPKQISDFFHTIEEREASANDTAMVEEAVLGRRSRWLADERYVPEDPDGFLE